MSHPENSSNANTTPIAPVPVSIASPISQRRRVNVNYTPDELMSVLQIMEEILPIGPNEWQLVADNHAENYTRRDATSIRRKWQVLHRMKIPTGDPEILEDVRIAKRIHYKIGLKADLGTERDTFDLTTGQLTGPNTPPDEKETINKSNSISSVPTSTTQSPAIRRTHIRSTHQSRGRHH